MAEYYNFDWNHRKIIPEPGVYSRKHPPADPTQSINALKCLIQQSDDYNVTDFPQDAKTLQKFLYARNFDVEESYTLLQNYIRHRKQNQALFENLDHKAPDIREAFENCLPGVLPTKDRKGRCVLILNGSNWDCSYSLLTIYRALLCSLEFLINDIHNQARGFVIIVDWTEFSFKQTSCLKPSALRLMIDGLQDCFPAKFKGIHFIGQPWYVDAALTVIKAFLKEQIKERIFVHGNNLSTLHDLVHKDILPAELGGEKPSYNPQEWLKRIEET